MFVKTATLLPVAATVVRVAGGGGRCRVARVVLGVLGFFCTREAACSSILTCNEDGNTGRVTDAAL